MLSLVVFTVVICHNITFFFYNLPNNDLTDGGVKCIFCVTRKEEDEKERLRQVKELQESSVGENTEALEEFFLTVDEACADLLLFLPFE